MINANTKKEASRKKSLGELGELFSIKTLVDEGFDKIQNLNDKKRTYPYADLYAEKEGKKYVISVKARNKYQKKDNSLNAFYKLGKNAYQHSEKAEKENNAVAYWMAIQFDKNSYSVFFGSLADLKGKLAIPIKECAIGKVGKILVNNKRHYFDFDYYSNRK